MADGGIVRLNPRQLEAARLLGGPQQHTMLVGGSRSGKTFLLLYAVISRALRAPNTRHLVVRFRYSHIKQSVWLDTLPKLMRLEWPVTWQATYKNGQDTYIRLPNGSEVWFAGLDDKERVERILGNEYSTIFFNECSQLSYAAVTMALTRLAQLSDGLDTKAYYDINPTGTGHWTYKLFVEKKRPGTIQLLPDPHNYAHFYLNPADNAANISKGYLEMLSRLPDKQRRRFFDGVYAADVDNGLWTLELIDKHRITREQKPEHFHRVVIAVDPSGASGPDDSAADPIGLVAVGLTVEKTESGEFRKDAYLLEDRTGLYSPENWARIACEMFRNHKADRIIGEKNFGGDLVRAVIHAHDRNVPYKDINASRGKAIRAEPVSALYEQGRVHHVGSFEQLEDELVNFTTTGYIGERSPNRADALVHAITDLIVAPRPVPRIRLFTLK